MGQAFITRRGGGGTDTSGEFITLNMSGLNGYYTAKLGTTTTYLDFATITVPESVKDVIVLCQFDSSDAAVFLTKPNEEVSCSVALVSATATATLYYTREGTNLKLYAKKDSTRSGSLNIHARVVGR